MPEDWPDREANVVIVEEEDGVVDRASGKVGTKVWGQWWQSYEEGGAPEAVCLSGQ